ncbi:MAG: hypothetical protein LCH95_11950 [Proteobacteria bacterium]|nr:hypothetical protein [Pseudomonadota bacterium]
MTDTSVTIAQRLAFLERELDRLGRSADDMEHELQQNPTDEWSGRRLGAIYAVAGQTWSKIRELRAEQSRQITVIHFDRDAELDDAADLAWRRALC